MKSNIALIGFMATGKSSAGKLLAERLGKKFVELDALIVHKAGKSLAEIFEKDGEIGFREKEIAATKEVAAGSNQVISCGGGVVLNQINVDRLKQSSIMVYLTATPEAILERTASDKINRPMLKSDDKAKLVRQLLEFRQPFYERSADITIDTTDISLETVVDEVIRTIEELGWPISAK